MKDLPTRFAGSLEHLKELQDNGVIAIRSKMLTRSDREILTSQGFIREVLRGWYVATKPDEKEGDSTFWYASFWGFCASYLEERLDGQWHLSAEQSLQLHIGDRTIPRQLLVRSPKGRNNPTEFLHNTSVLDIRQAMPDEHLLTVIEGVRVYTLPAALVYCSPKTFVDRALQVRTALSMISDASDVLEVLIKGGHSTIAGRLAGAFRNIGRKTVADTIISSMKTAGYKVKEEEPFQESAKITFGRREVSPYVNRMYLMWTEMREQIIEIFPAPSTQLQSSKAYLDDVEEKFITDAYHSLSIEGYRVSRELIEHVRSGQWEPDNSPESQKHKDAMAAKGYWDAFQEVKEAVRRVLEGENPGEVLESVHGSWYLALFGPSVVAGILKQSELAGYRSGPVYIRQSMHTPPNRDAVRDMMPALFELLIEEDNAAVRIVLGHFIFVYIHPYVDGNGRMGRFIMNLMMASGQYPWTVVPVERRDEYMASLESASVDGSIVPFTKFLASLLNTA